MCSAREPNRVLGAHHGFNLEPGQPRLQQPVRGIATDLQIPHQGNRVHHVLRSVWHRLGSEHPSRRGGPLRRVHRGGGTWSPVANPAIPSSDNISADFATLFRASLIVGVGLERKIAGPTSLMVGLTYNNSLFNTHKGSMWSRWTAPAFRGFPRGRGSAHHGLGWPRQLPRLERGHCLLNLCGHDAMNPEAVTEHIVAWLRNYLEQSGMEGWVVGVSGGIDSRSPPRCAR